MLIHNSQLLQVVNIVCPIQLNPLYTSRKATGDLTRDLTVLSLVFALKITFDFHAKRRPQNQSNLLQIRRISEQVGKMFCYNDSPEAVAQSASALLMTMVAGSSPDNGSFLFCLFLVFLSFKRAFKELSNMNGCQLVVSFLVFDFSF